MTTLIVAWKINTDTEQTDTKWIYRSNLYSNLIKKMKNLYTENYRKLIKETEDTKKWKNILCSRIGKILLKCQY